MDNEKHEDLGSWVGLQKAFAAVAGSCSSARAQCLKQVRDSHMLDDLGLTWDEFCHDYAGITRRHADDLIRQYERFGEPYFRLSGVVRVSPETFQQIAPHLTSDTAADILEIEGQKLPVTPENAGKIREFIQRLRLQVRRAPERPTASVIELQLRVDALARDLDKAIAALHPVPNPPPPYEAGDRAELRSLSVYAVNKFREVARRLGAAV